MCDATEEIAVEEAAGRLGLTPTAVCEDLALLTGAPSAEVHDGWPAVHVPFGELLPLPAVEGRASEVRIRVRERREVEPTPLLRSRIGLGTERIVMIEQLAELDGEPLYVLVGYYATDEPGALAAVFEEVHGGGSLYRLGQAFRELFGVAPGPVESVIEAVRCDEHTAGLLGVAPGSPVLLRELLLLAEDGIARAVAYVYGRADRITLDEPEGARPAR